MIPDTRSFDDRLLISFCEQWEAARRDGRVVSAEHLCVARPDLLPDLLRAIEVLGAMDATTDYPGRGSNVPPDLPGYELIREIGRGGMGVVYSARHIALNRVVAVKLVPAAGVTGAGRLARFRQEAEAVARLQHPNIVQIFETGLIGESPFLTLEFVDGDNLRRRIAGTPQPTREAAKLVETVARALHHAHEHRIVHRDIKPANILLTDSGVPKVTDFGLARSLDTDTALTVTSDFLGTPAYAAPEQIHNRTAAIGPATDIYGLGATLYELLTGRPPFEAASLPDLLRQVSDHEATPLRSLRPDCPRDLETICLKCLEKDPARRYPTALAMAEDLRRFLADEPIMARPLGSLGRGWKWAKRNPVVAGLLATIGFVLTTAAIVGAVLSSSLAVALNDAKKDRDRAVKAEEQGQRKLFAAYVSEANAIRASGQPGQRFTALERVRQALALGDSIALSPEDRLAARNAAAAALCQPDLCPGPDWDVYAPAGDASPVSIARAKAHRFRPSGGTVQGAILVGPTGRFVVVSKRTWLVQTDNAFELWRLDGPAPVLVFDREHAIHESAVAFSPDESKIAVGRMNGGVSVYSTVDGELLTSFDDEPGFMWRLVWHPDGEKLAVVHLSKGDDVRQLRVWNTAASPPSIWAMTHFIKVYDCAFHPDGKSMATAGADGFIRQWELPSGRMTSAWPARVGGGSLVTFDSTGRCLMGSAWDGVQRLWDAATGRELAQLAHGANALQPGSSARLGAPAIHNDRFYETRISESREHLVLNRTMGDGSLDQILRVAVHPGGRLIASSTTREIAFIDAATSRTVATLPTAAAGSFRFDDQGHFWTDGPRSGAEAPLLRWPVQIDPSFPHRLRIGPPEYVGTKLWAEAYSVSSDGRTVALPRGFGGQVVRLGAPAQIGTYGPQSDVRSTALSPDGRILATNTFFLDGSGVFSKVWDTTNGRQLAWLPEGQANTIRGFSSDGRWVETIGGVAPVHRRWDLASVDNTLLPKWEETRPRPKAGGMSPDGRISAWPPDGGMINLHDEADGSELVRLPFAGVVTQWCWSADSCRFFVLDQEGMKLHVFDLRRIRRQLAALGLDWTHHPDLQPEPAWENDPFAPPLEVRVVAGLAAASRFQLTASELTRAAGDLALNPLDADARYRLGMWMVHQGRAVEAFPQLSAALALDPRQTAAFIPLAEAAYKSGQWAEASRAAGHAIVMNPFNGYAYRISAESEAALGHHEEAVRRFNHALTLHPAHLPLLIGRAEEHRMLGNLANVVDDMNQVDRIIANGPMPANDYAWDLVTGPVALRNPTRALMLMEKIRSRYAMTPVFLNTLGVAQYRSGRYSDAAVTFENSLDIGQGKSDGYDLFFLAMCRHKLGDTSGASKHFQDAALWTDKGLGHTESMRIELAAFRREAAKELGIP